MSCTDCRAAYKGYYIMCRGVSMHVSTESEFMQHGLQQLMMGMGCSPKNSKT